MPINSASMPYLDLSKIQTQRVENIKPETEEDKKLKDVCNDFESIFVNMMLKTMRGTVDDGESLIPKSAGTKMFEEMRDQELASKLSKEGSGFGLSDLLYKQMKVSKAYKQNG